ncbi:MAG: hypothetical protein ACRBK7_24305 [Acidimicrobiales bacterium]
MTVRSLRSILSGLALAAICGFGLAACGSDGDDGAADDGASTDETSQEDAPNSDSADGDGDGVAVAAGTSSTIAPQPEQAVPALVGANSNDVTVGGFIFEDDGLYLLCETTTDGDPPECDGETIEIANGDVIDPTIFLGEPGSQYSDAEVVVTGDVVDGVLTIG